MLRRLHTHDDLLPAGAPPLPSLALSGAAVPRRALTVSALALSAAAHAAVFVMLVTRAPNETGVLDIETDAISVEMVASQVLDAIEAEDAVKPQVSSAAVAEGAIPEMKSLPPQAEQMQPVEPEAIAPSPASPEQTVDSLAAIAGEAAAEEPLGEAHEPAPREAAPPQPDDRRHETKEKEKRQKPAAAPATRRPESKSERDVAAGARAVKGSTGARARVSASQGDVAGYAAKVRARVASRRPSGNGARGTVIVSFSVAGSGGLSSARISSSSGNARLDAAALQAVRGAGPFPPTPTGARLSFAVPFHYR